MDEAKKWPIIETYWGEMKPVNQCKDCKQKVEKYSVTWLTGRGCVYPLYSFLCSCGRRWDWEHVEAHVPAEEQPDGKMKVKEGYEKTVPLFEGIYVEDE